MKKFITLLIVMVLMLAMATPAYAQEFIPDSISDEVNTSDNNTCNESNAGGNGQPDTNGNVLTKIGQIIFGPW